MGKARGSIPSTAEKEKKKLIAHFKWIGSTSRKLT